MTGDAREFLLLPQSSLVFLGRWYVFTVVFFLPCPEQQVGFGSKFGGTDGKPTKIVHRSIVGDTFSLGTLRLTVSFKRRPLFDLCLPQLARCSLSRS